MVPLAELLDRYLKSCEAASLTARTISNRGIYLRHFIEWLARRGLQDIRRVSSADIDAYRQELFAHRYRFEKAGNAPWRALNPRTIHTRLLIVGQLFEWLVLGRVLVVDPSAGLTSKALPRQLPVRSPTESEMIRILSAADTRRPIGKRNQAILELLYSTGLRLSELAALDLTDLDLTAGTLHVRCGKGGKGRVVPLGEAAVSAILDYLQETRPRFQRGRPGVLALFLAATHCGQTGQRLSTASIRDIVQQAGRAARIHRRINPHQVRHACATHMLRAGADLRHIQQLLGHSRIDTTEIYTRVDVSDLADVLARSHPRCKPQHS